MDSGGWRGYPTRHGTELLCLNIALSRQTHIPTELFIFVKKVAIKHCKRVICIKKIVSKKIIHHFVVLYMNSIYFCNITIKQMIMKKYEV